MNDATQLIPSQPLQLVVFLCLDLSDSLKIGPSWLVLLRSWLVQACAGDDSALLAFSTHIYGHQHRRRPNGAVFPPKGSKKTKQLFASSNPPGLVLANV
jgi:hypothetical protein